MAHTVAERVRTYLAALPPDARRYLIQISLVKRLIKTRMAEVRAAAAGKKR